MQLMDNAQKSRITYGLEKCMCPPLACVLSQVNLAVFKALSHKNAIFEKRNK